MNALLSISIHLVTLKRIDFTGNIISEIEDGAFAKLTMLEELSLAWKPAGQVTIATSEISLLQCQSQQTEDQRNQVKCFQGKEPHITLPVWKHY